VFVSSVSAHPMPYAGPVSEDTPVSECPPDAGPDDGDYGVLKAGCENAVRTVLGDRATVVRPGLILGPWENVGRLPWWLARMARGGDVLAPGAPDRPFQAVDGRDLARFCLDLALSGPTGTFDVVGPRGRHTWGELLELLAEVTAAGSRLVWVDDATLLEAEVEPWTELPLWLPDDPETAHFFDVVPARAEAAGLRCRPLADTVADAWRWLCSLEGPPRAARAHGIDPDKEAAILASLA
jgi:2'-hydroxyisoflavone reductase